MKRFFTVLLILSIVIATASCSQRGINNNSDVSDNVSKITEISDDAVSYNETSDFDESEPEDVSQSVSKDAEVSSTVTPIGAVDYECTFETDYPCLCKLSADVTLVSTSELDVAVTVSVKLTSKQIIASARNNSGVVIIGDKEFYYSTPALEHYESETAIFEFVTQSRTVTRNADGSLTFDVGATWPFNGIYSNVEIGIMSALGTLTINPDGSVK